jgi:hypothetical protein
MNEDDRPEVKDAPVPEVRLSNRQRRLLLPAITPEQVDAANRWAKMTRQQRRAEERKTKAA